MKNNTFALKILFISLLCHFYGPATAQQDAQWELKRQSDGLKVYVRDAAHSDVKEIKIETTLDASLHGVVAVLKDVPVYKDWIYKCLEANRLQPAEQKSSLYYCKVDFPWPMSDRDFIARSQLRQDPDSRTVYIDVKGEPDNQEDVEDVVRIRNLDIHYELTPLAGNKTQMSYQLHSDPGGAIPTWLVNMVVDNGPVNTIKGMREMLKSEKYQNAQFAFLK
ncbi:MAG: START domain-containing protein [Phaeodactylibacter sp.]|uniref:START domain-containing protein n=1 Tax=Phaeodactylibacter sp. TaxID=1940289 RepID=UPI0032ECBCAF